MLSKRWKRPRKQANPRIIRGNLALGCKRLLLIDGPGLSENVKTMPNSLKSRPRPAFLGLIYKSFERLDKALVLVSPCPRVDVGSFTF